MTISGTIPSNPGDTGTNAETWSVAGFQATSQPINFSVTPGCQVGLINYPGNPPRFYFDTTYWYYGGSMASTGIAAAASAWNGTGNGITLTNDSTGTLQTVDLEDDSSIAPLLGTDLTYNFSNGGSSCYDHSGVTCSGLCANSSKMYYSSIKFNPGGISSTATSYGISVSTALEQVASHELGHAFGLADYTGALDCASPTTMSQTGGQDFQCRLYTPQTCDTSRVNTFFSGWTIWSFSTCGPTCNLSANCT